MECNVNYYVCINSSIVMGPHNNKEFIAEMAFAKIYFTHEVPFVHYALQKWHFVPNVRNEYSVHIAAKRI